MKQEYELIRSRRKTVALVIRKDATLEVRAPLKMSRDAIDAFVFSKQSWVNKHIGEQKALYDLRGDFAPDYGKTALFFGHELTIEASECKKAKICDGKILMPPYLGSEEIKAQLIALYKSEAAQYIKPRVEEKAKEMNIFPSSVHITSARTRWGSCTADRLSFSWHLIMADKSAVDYVIIHELSHIVHHNHGDKFWALVGTYCPEYKLLRASLKPLAKRLNSENWDNSTDK